MHVGNDSESNGYRLYNRVGHETTTRGIVKFVENVDMYGKVLSTQDKTFVYNYSTTTNTPQGYIYVNDYNDFSGRILDISVYCYTKDLQTYGLVQFKKGNETVWANAECLLRSTQRREANMKETYFSIFATGRTKRK